MIYGISPSRVSAGLSWVALLLMRKPLGWLAWLHSAGSSAGPSLSRWPPFCAWGGWASWGLPGLTFSTGSVSPSTGESELLHMGHRRDARSLMACELGDLSQGK